MPTARTEISTARAGRYLIQLCEHLNRASRHPRHGATHANGPRQVRRVEWTEDHGVIEFPAGRCILAATPDTLTITVTADGTDELQRMQTLFATRLHTIGRRDDLTVTWRSHPD